MSSSPFPTVAFFGATGGITNATLVHTLLGGYRVAALVRTPDKLRKQLTDQGLKESLIAQNLTIVSGNALEVAAVKSTLTAAIFNGRLPSHIVTGLGGTPHMQLDWKNPGHVITLDNPTLCGTAAAALVTALEELYAERPHLAADKPLLTFVSTTGISRGPEDVPLGMRLFYHQALAIPHVDKRKMEEIFRSDATKPKSKSVFRNVIGIRPAFLAGTPAYTDANGLAKVKYGVENNPAVGYSIKRADAGHWIFHYVIEPATRKTELEGEMVTLTY